MKPANLFRPLVLSLMVLAASHGGNAVAASAPRHVAESFEGTLVAGGGIDDLFVTVRRPDGRTLHVMCDGRCDEAWFEDTGEGVDASRLKRAFVGKRIAVTVKTERNNGRIVGPDQDDMLVFLKSLRFIK